MRRHEIRQRACPSGGQARRSGNEGDRLPLQFIIDRCLGKDGACLDTPFGESPICAKWMGHIFAEIYPRPGDFKITLRCDPEVGKAYDACYPDVVVPAYHVPERQRQYKRTILLDREKIDQAGLARMIDHSYENLVARYGREESATF